MLIQLFRLKVSLGFLNFDEAVLFRPGELCSAHRFRLAYFRSPVKRQGLLKYGDEMAQLRHRHILSLVEYHIRIHLLMMLIILLSASRININACAIGNEKAARPAQ